MVNTIDITVLKSKIYKSLDLLQSTYHSKDGKGGWYHYLDENHPGATASAVGLMSFKLAKAPFSHTREVLAFLKAKQFTSDDPRKNGGWSISMMSDQPSIEASGWVIKCLGVMNSNLVRESPSISEAYEWLLKNQNDDYGWGSFYAQPSRTYLTCMALRAIAAINPVSDALSLGKKWLLENKNRNVPAWGATQADPPSILHTGFVLVTLAEIDPFQDKLAIQDSLNWLSKMLNPYQIVEASSQVEDYDIIGADSRIVYQYSLPHFALPVAIAALLKYEHTLDNDMIYQGLLTILESQKEDGSWENARNPARPSMWAVWYFLQTLFEVVNLPIISSAKSVIKMSDALVIHTQKTTTPLLLLLGQDLLTFVIRTISNYWGVMLLVVFVVGGLILTSMDAIRVNEYILSLLLPVILLFIQFSLEKKKKKK